MHDHHGHGYGYGIGAAAAVIIIIIIIIIIVALFAGFNHGGALVVSGRSDEDSATVSASALRSLCRGQ